MAIKEVIEQQRQNYQNQINQANEAAAKALLSKENSSATEIT